MLESYLGSGHEPVLVETTNLSLNLSSPTTWGPHTLSNGSTYLHLYPQLRTQLPITSPLPVTPECSLYSLT